MAGGVLGYPMAARSLGRRKRKGETPTEGFGIGSTVSRLSSIGVRDPVERCCICTRHLTCSTMGPSTRAYEFRNSGRQCTGCFCWGQWKNWGRIMTSPTTERGLLGIFPHGAVPPVTDQRATTLPSNLRHLLPCGQYQRPGPGEGARGVGQAAARA